ncbi:MAG: glycosyltransferase family 2 protein [Ilumatobacteraceae bacterium]
MSSRQRTLVIQIPCFNEEQTLAATVADLPRAVDGFDAVMFLVVDDGSTDRTVEVARQCGVHHVVSHQRNRGLAAAFLTGLDTALRLGADVIVNTDADNQYSASSIPALVRPVLDGSADLVVGERPIESIANFSPVKKRLQRIGTRVVRLASGTPVEDAASGFRAMNRETALRLHVFGRFTYTMETLIQAGAEQLAVVSVPIEVNPQTRPSRLVRSSAQYVRRSAAAIIRSFAIYRPFRFFAAIAAIPSAIGAGLIVRWILLWQFADDYQSRVPSLVIAAVFLLIGAQILTVAFLADLMASTRRLVADTRYRARRAELDAQGRDAG